MALMIRQIANAIPDGHANFFLPTLQDETSGSAGMVLSQLTDGRVAVGILRSNGPAANAGIERGAIITAINGRPIADAMKAVTLTFSNASTPAALARIQLADLTRGPMGSTLEVTFENPNAESRTVTLTRDTPQRVSGRPSVNAPGNLLPSGFGYWRIPSFGGINQLEEFDEAINGFIQANVPSIIIDIRNNPGGFSQISDAMAGRFFEEGFIVGKQFASDGRYVYQMEVYPRQPIYTGQIIILVNEQSSSAADLFAYTLQSQGRGRVVGFTPTSGMAGTVSGGQYSLPGGGFIQVPTGSLKDDAGNIIVEGQGVKPDVQVALTVESLLSDEDAVLKAAEESLAVPVP
jgi:carboxyl-terminal processing protease